MLPAAVLVLAVVFPQAAVLPWTATTLLAGGEGQAPLPSGPHAQRVGPGIYRPVYPPSPEETEVPVAAFLLDETPVTTAEFQAFVTAHSSWQRGRVSRLFADERYLAAWAGPADFGPELQPDQPVVGVSWFAAKAYCEARGARLPTEAEWELAAAASETQFDARSDVTFTKRILEWYAKPGGTPLPRVGRGPANAWGVRDLHGLVWEWVLDFNSALVAVDNREDGGADNLRFCGASALAAADKEDYAAFMRIAFRSSLEARFTTSNLGFRCAADAPADAAAAALPATAPSPISRSTP